MKKIRHIDQLNTAISEYLTQGKTLQEIVTAVNERGAICSAVAVERIIAVITQKRAK